jgi:ribosomal protein S12 methylthiotransferase accessory factor
MKLLPQPKYGSVGTHRVMSAADTCRRVRPYMQAIGVTRVADTTGLDSLGMPVFSAIRPTDAGLDGISVYNGKGLTKADARAGAMMEAIERYSAESWPRERQRGTRPQIAARNRGTRVMNPASMILQQQRSYSDATVLDWGEGWDLLHDEPVLIPLAMILAPYDGPGRGIWYASSNGLASGNTMEEAVCHALAELIERDAYTIALVRAELVPRVHAFLEAVTTGLPQPPAEIDRRLFPSVKLDTVPPMVHRLVAAAQRDGNEVWLRDITSDLRIPAFVASMRRWEPDGAEFAAGGFGCHPNAAIAAVRAVTETAQGRNVQIQGVREDAKAVPTAYGSAQRVLWCQDAETVVSFSQIASYVHSDILDDLNLMLDRLRADGVQQVYAVDLSRPQIPAAVVRLIIPEMESWFLTDFDPDQCRLGRRAQRYLPPG